MPKQACFTFETRTFCGKYDVCGLWKQPTYDNSILEKFEISLPPPNSIYDFIIREMFWIICNKFLFNITNTHFIHRAETANTIFFANAKIKILYDCRYKFFIIIKNWVFLQLHCGNYLLRNFSSNFFQQYCGHFKIKKTAQNR